MNQSEGKLAPKEYSFVTQDMAINEQSGPLTLLRRSKRVLGDIDLGEASIPTQSESSTSEPGTTKRREQVRKAQRMHRQRTQAYIKELENEVLRLRSVESDSQARAAKLQQDVNSLLTLLQEHFIIPPPGIVSEPPRLPGPTGHVKLSSLENPKAASVGLSFLPTSATSPSLTTRFPETVSGSESESPALCGGQSTFPEPGSDAATSPYAPPTVLQDPQVGIDFVLTLERPCLPHLRDSHLDYDDRAETPSEQSWLNSGHLFTASLHLWQPSLRDRSSPESYEVSTSELERLLSTSLNIGVKDDEITPIQIWNLLKNLAIPADQQKELLQTLADELFQHVECLHFGAIIKIDKLDRIINQYLPGGIRTS